MESSFTVQLPESLSDCVTMTEKMDNENGSSQKLESNYEKEGSNVQIVLINISISLRELIDIFKPQCIDGTIR